MTILLANIHFELPQCLDFYHYESLGETEGNAFYPPHFASITKMATLALKPFGPYGCFLHMNGKTKVSEKHGYPQNKDLDAL